MKRFYGEMLRKMHVACSQQRNVCMQGEPHLSFQLISSHLVFTAFRS